MELWNSAVADIVVYREWKNLALVYCDNIQDVQSLVQILNKQSKREVLLLNAAPGPALLYLLRLVKKREMTKVIINCNDYQLLLDLLRLVRNVFLNSTMIFGPRKPLLRKGQRNCICFQVTLLKNELKKIILSFLILSYLL